MIGADREIERDTHTGRHADMHACSQSNTCRYRHGYRHFCHASTVRQTGTQPARQLYALRHTQIQADTCRECLYRQLHAEIDIYRHAQTEVQRQTETDIYRQRHTDTDRDRQIQTETKHRQTDTFRYIQRQTYTYSDTPAER